MDEEVIFDGGDRIALEVERLSRELDRELNFDTPKKKAKFHSISLYSDDDEDDDIDEHDNDDNVNDNDNYNDDDSLESELHGLASSQQLLQTELQQADSDSASGSPAEHYIVAQHVPHDNNLYVQIHDQLPLADEYKAARQITPQCSSARPDPPSYVNDPLTRSTSDKREAHRRSSDGLMRVAPDPEEGRLTRSERHARVSQLPSVKNLRRRLRRQSTRKRRRLKLAGLVGCTVLIFTLLAIVLPILLVENDQERNKKVTDLLSLHQISNWQDLKTPGTPQYKAARWIAEQDRARVSIGMHRAFLDRYILAVLYFTMGGDTTWPSSLNFLSRKPVCQWLQSTPNPLDNDLTMGVHGCRNIDGELVPIGLALAFHGLNGLIPDEIQYLDKLEVLILQYNPALGGSIPSALSKLTNLRSLSLEHCSLSGRLPDWLGSMTQLTRLGLSDNRLLGSIPTSIQQLTNLRKLGLDDNSLQGDLSLFQPLADLKFLYLDDNSIQGKLTSELLASWPDLVELDVSENQISGSIPNDLFSHRHLKVLDLHANRLIGRIPDVLVETNVELEFLALQENELSQAIPSSIASLRSLRHLDVSMNALTSTIPFSMSTMLHLKSLFLGDNNFDAETFPNFLTGLSGMQELSLNNMEIQGSIPNALGFLSDLRYLDLSSNALTGSLSDSLGFLSNLDHLLLRNNRLTGSLPDKVDFLSNLDVLLLEANDLTGTANILCQAESWKVAYFASDCGGSQPTFECECCTVCCEGEASCNDLDWKGNLDPQWEFDYTRHRYKFSQGITFVP